MPDQLTIHSVRVTPNTAKVRALFLAYLGISKSPSRPKISNDNPYSESQLKTLKYRPAFPPNFGCIEDCKTFSRGFFHWYNNEHYHSGIGLMTPHSVHYGQADAIWKQRQRVLNKAFDRHPERSVYPKCERLWSELHGRD